ncbi:DUF4303 domain-containing protein [Permianibacter aggregans]|uniref:Uncharacterized protein DUF4303 n=1 Tax=Permianibacter aggregans TaxID=1510150 RepID=A0A4R6UR89_9GAMM|nr:DUF4303 domain-containing protein [Permianibacter aggregans]QGX41028.1 DUF4303 domain-containing protein [Permianibacter aggregans]TDQ48093.1 uncharacterized protein DUF4303 [Permianibacter aggregans]
MPKKKQISYENLTKLLAAEASKGITQFSVTEDSVEVYAVAFSAEPNSGSVSLHINTESVFEARKSTTYHECDEKQVNGLFGFRFNPHDFGFHDFWSFPDELSDWAEEYEAHLESLETDEEHEETRERFFDAVAAAIGQVQNELAFLNKTEHFIAFVSYYDSSRELKEHLMRKTVGEATFDKLFPEVRRFNELIIDINQLSTEVQISYWLGVLKTYESKDEIGQGHFLQYRYYLDVEEHLAELGQDALPAIFAYLDQVIFLNEFNLKGGKQWTEDGAFNRQAAVSHLLLNTIARIGDSAPWVERALKTYIQTLTLHNEGVQETVGLNSRLAARCLHELFPEKYPKEDVCQHSNRLLNAWRYA